MGSRLRKPTAHSHRAIIYTSIRRSDTSNIDTILFYIDWAILGMQKSETVRSHAL